MILALTNDFDDYSAIISDHSFVLGYPGSEFSPMTFSQATII